MRRTVWFAGCVQGVGFRYTTRAVAAGFRVTGYVRNLADGRVEVVVEGESGEIDRFLHAVQEAMRGFIRSMEHVDGPATGEFADFGIRF